MKVLHINSEKSWRGGEQQMANLMEELDKKNITNYICCRSGSKMSEFADRKNIEKFTLSFSGLKFINALSLKKYVTKMNFDIIHTHTANAHTLAFYASIAGMKTPIVVSKRTDFPVKTLRKFELDNLKAILCVSQKIEEIVKQKVKNHSIVHTVYSGINIKRFNVDQSSLKKYLEISEQAPLIGNTSAIADQKDYATFLNVAKRLPHYNFVIIGSGPMEAEIKSLAKSLNLSNVYFTGFLNNIEEYLKSLDLFLITSKTEGLGTSILDAMICNIPVVATKAGGIPEIVIDHETGLLSEIANDEDLAKKVETLLNDKALRERLILNAYKNVSENFSKEKTALKTIQIYKS